MMIYYNFPGDSKAVIFFNILIPVGYFFTQKKHFIFMLFSNLPFKKAIL